METARGLLTATLGAAVRFFAALFFATFFLAGTFLALATDLDFLVLALLGMDRHLAGTLPRTQDCCARFAGWAEREVCWGS